MSTPSTATRLLADVRASLRVLWAAGLRRPDPTLPDQLADLAHDSEAMGWGPLAGVLRELAREVSAALADPRVDRSTTVFALQRGVWVRVHLLARRLSLVEVGVRLEQEAAGVAPAPPPTRRGRSGTIYPVGVQRSEGLWQLHGLDDDGRWVTLEDRPLATDPDDPFRGRTTSRLFHDDVRLHHLLLGEWNLRDHPGTSTRLRWVGRPAFHTRPQVSVRRSPGPPLRELPLGARQGLGVRKVRFTHTPAGWVGLSRGASVPVGPRLAFDLDKRSLDAGDELTLEAAVVASGDELVVLSVDEPPRFPTVDPAATCWALERWLAPTDDPAERERQDQLRALLWPLVGGDRGQLAQRLAPQLRSPRTLDERWQGQWAGRALGLPAPDACAEAEALLAQVDAEPLALLQALWLALRADRPVEPAADHLLAHRGGPIDAHDTLEIVLRGWLLITGSHPDPSGFLAAHGASFREADVLPDVAELTWILELWRFAREREVGVEAIGLARWPIARAAMSALRTAAGRCTPQALAAWRLITSAQVERWFVQPG